MIKERRRLRDLLDRNPPPGTRQQYNKITAMIKRESLKQKQQRWAELCQSLDPHKGDSKIWKLLKGIDKGSEPGLQQKSNMFKRNDGSHITDDREVADEFARHYSNVSKLDMDTTLDQKVAKKSRTIVNNARSCPSKTDLFRDSLLEQ